MARPYVSNYMAEVLPDQNSSRNQELANGDVRHVIFRGWEHFLRTIANMPPQSLNVSLIAAFTPRYQKGHRQSRLQFYIRVVARDDHIAQAMDTLIRGSLLCPLYQFRRVTAIPRLGEDPPVYCHIVRKEDFIKPLYSREFNQHIPDWYYSIVPFVADEGNCNLEYDRVLDGVEEEVRIIIQVQPEDVLGELAASTRYFSRLQSINRSGFDDDAHTVTERMDAESGMFANWHDRIGPLHRRDPMADELLRTHRRFHESLRLPHVLFNIAAAAETEATARLVASIVGESGFAEGSYRLVVSGKAGKASTGVSTSAETVAVGLLPVRQNHWPDGARRTYEAFGRLSQLASVEELLGVFRLPVASFASPCCIRKDTDPPDLDPPKMIVLGHDQQLFAAFSRPPGTVRGLPLDRLNTHWFMAGKTRSGKTTVIVGAALQLSGLLSPDEIEEG